MIIISGPMQRYTISEYAQYPEAFWYLLYGEYSIGIFLAVWYRNVARFRHIGMLFAIVSQTLMISALSILGYFATDPYDGTVAIGYAKSIELTGTLVVGDFYPAFHIIEYAVGQMTRLQLSTLALLTVPALYLMYLLGVYVFVRAIGRGREAAWLALVLASPLVYTLILVPVPRTFVFCLIPLFLTAAYRLSKGKAGLVAILSLILMLVIAHPLDGGPMLVIPLVLTTMLSLGVNLNLKRRISSLRSNATHLVGVIMIICLVWLIWVLRFNGLSPYLQELVSGSSGAGLAFVTSTISKSHLPTTLVTGIILKEFGGQFEYMTAGVVGLLYLFVSTKQRRRAVPLYAASLFLFYGVWILLTSTLPVELVFWRFIGYLMFASSVLLAFLASEVKRRSALILVLSLVLSSQAIGASSLYSSPWTSTVSITTTRADVASVQWLSGKTSPLTVVRSVLIPASSLVSAVFGMTPSFGANSTSAPNSQLRYKLDGSILYFPSYAPVYYPDKFPNYPANWGYSPRDASKMISTAGICIVYSNPDISLFLLGC